MKRFIIVLINILLAIIIITVLHEMGHGLALVLFGEHPTFYVDMNGPFGIRWLTIYSESFEPNLITILAGPLYPALIFLMLGQVYSEYILMSIISVCYSIVEYVDYLYCSEVIGLSELYLSTIIFVVVLVSVIYIYLEHTTNGNRLLDSMV